MLFHCSTFKKAKVSHVLNCFEFTWTKRNRKQYLHQVPSSPLCIFQWEWTVSLVKDCLQSSLLAVENYFQNFLWLKINLFWVLKRCQNLSFVIMQETYLWCHFTKFSRTDQFWIFRRQITTKCHCERQTQNLSLHVAMNWPALHALMIIFVFHGWGSGWLLPIFTCMQIWVHVENTAMRTVVVLLSCSLWELIPWYPVAEFLCAL